MISSLFFEAPKKRKTQPGSSTVEAAACAIFLFGLQNNKIKLFGHYRHFNLNGVLQIEYTSSLFFEIPKIRKTHPGSSTVEAAACAIFFILSSKQ